MSDHQSTQFGCIEPEWPWLGLTGPASRSRAQFLSSSEKRVQSLADDKILLCQKHLVTVLSFELGGGREMSETGCC